MEREVIRAAVQARGRELHCHRDGYDRLNALFWPESIAIVGATPKGGFATDILNNLKKWGFSGKIAAVNPRYEEIEGVPCYPSLVDIPQRVGLAMVAFRPCVMKSASSCVAKPIFSACGRH